MTLFGVNLAARTCDINTCEFFLSGYVKSKVCRSNSIAELKNEIRRLIGSIDLSICEEVIKSFFKITRTCGLSNFPTLMSHFELFNYHIFLRNNIPIINDSLSFAFEYKSAMAGIQGNYLQTTQKILTIKAKNTPKRVV